MQGRELTDLPDILLLHIFSFIPSLRDAVMATTVSKQLRIFYHTSSFWRARMPFDYACNAPLYKDPSQFYLELRGKVAEERQLCAAYLAAYQHIVMSEAAAEAKTESIKKLDNALEHLPLEGFMSVTNSNEYGCALVRHANHHASTANQLFARLVLKQAKCASRMGALVPISHVRDHLSESYSQSASLFLLTLAACNAHLSLRLLLNACTSEERAHSLQVLGPDLLCRAASFGQVESVKYLLEAGVNPNKYGYYLCLDTVKLEALPMFLVHQLQIKSKRMQTKGGKIMQIIQLLLQHGANVDLPATRVFNAGNMVNDGLPSSRTVMMRYQEIFNQRAHRHQAQEVVRMQCSLQVVIDAPVIEPPRLHL